MNLKISAFVFAFLAVLYYYRDEIAVLFGPLDESLSKHSDRLFTVEELSKCDGVKSEFLYLSILGKVYDVTEGAKHYGLGTSYNIFVGRDASRSFVTGEFDPDAEDLDDVLKLSNSELLGLKSWMLLYDERYIYMGKLIGRFYDTNGKETHYMKYVQKKFEEGEAEKSNKDETNKKYPPCNTEWDANTGTRVWCTTKSGGIDRSWVGVPRQMHQPGSSDPYCVCIDVTNREHITNALLKEYEGCEPTSNSCRIKNIAN